MLKINVKDLKISEEEKIAFKCGGIIGSLGRAVTDLFMIKQIRKSTLSKWWKFWGYNLITFDVIDMISDVFTESQKVLTEFKERKARKIT